MAVQRRPFDSVTDWRYWLNTATLVFACWLGAFLLEGSVAPGIPGIVIGGGLPASVVLFFVGFGLFVRDRRPSSE